MAEPITVYKGERSIQIAPDALDAAVAKGWAQKPSKAYAPSTPDGGAAGKELAKSGIQGVQGPKPPADPVQFTNPLMRGAAGFTEGFTGKNKPQPILGQGVSPMEVMQQTQMPFGSPSGVKESIAEPAKRIGSGDVLGGTMEAAGSLSQQYLMGKVGKIGSKRIGQGHGTVDPTQEPLQKRADTKAIKGGKDTMSKMTGITPRTGPAIEGTIQSGHLAEIERQYEPRTVRDAAKATREYANNFEESHFKDAVSRYPDAKISGDDVAQALQKMQTPEVEQLSPTEMRTIQNEVKKFAGKDISLSVAVEHLRKLNARAQRMSRATPNNAAAAERINTQLRANTVKGAVLREAVYSRLEQLGYPNARQFQQEYGNLSHVSEVLYRNITRAERIGKGQSLTTTYLHHPWFIIGGLAGMAEGETMLGAASAAIPFIEWASRRRQTPNASTGRMFKQSGKSSFEAKPPDTPPTPKGLLGKGPIELGPHHDPIEPTGPTAQEPGRGKPARDPGTGQMKRTYTTSSTFNRPNVREWDSALGRAVEVSKGKAKPTQPVETGKPSSAYYEHARSEWEKAHPGKDPTRWPAVMRKIQANAKAMEKANQPKASPPPNRPDIKPVSGASGKLSADAEVARMEKQRAQFVKEMDSKIGELGKKIQELDRKLGKRQ